MAKSNRAQVDSYRRTRFNFGVLSKDVIGQITNLVDRGDSIVLLGPKGIGKRYILASVRQHIEGKGWNCIRINCEQVMQQPELDIPKIILTQIRPTIPEEITHSLGEHPRWHDLLRSRLHKGPATRYVFFVSNVDSLPSDFARKLLQELRALCHVQRMRTKLSVVLSGAYDLAPLVYGLNSDFDTSNQFVVQGFDEEILQECFQANAAACGIRVCPECTSLLFAQTRGNLLLLRIIMDTIIEHRRSNDIPPSVELETPELSHAIKIAIEHRSSFCDSLLRSFFRIEESHESLTMISQLMQDNSIEIARPSMQSNVIGPVDLELTGIAIRTSDDRLVWASKMIESLCCQHFSPWTIADSFAGNNDWRNAIKYYRHAFRNRSSFSISGSARPRFQGALRTFETALFRVASTEGISIDALCKYFSCGARALLGFTEVTYWKYDEQERRWELSRTRAAAIHRWDRTGTRKRLERQVIHSKIEAMLGPPSRMEPGLNKVDPLHSPVCLLAKLPQIDGMPPECVVLSNLDDDSPMTVERRRFSEGVATRFIEAFGLAANNQRRYSRARFHSRLLEKVIPKVLQLVSGRPEKTRAILETAGEALRAEEYRRVMFSIVDQFAGRIKGVVDCKNPAEQNIAEKTDFDLRILDRNGIPNYTDIQQKCVLEQIPIEVENALTHPLTNKEVVRIAGLESLVLIPLVYNDRALGTMHIERRDRKLPDPVELASLELFARQLAIAINATTEFDALEEALHQQSEAVIVCDREHRIHFANKRAANYYSIETGWSEPPISSRNVLSPDSRKAVDKVIQNGTKYTISKLDGKSFRIVEVEPILDWSGSINRYLIQVHFLDRLAALLHATQAFAKCHQREALAQEILGELKQQGYPWARIYRFIRETDVVDKHGENTLVNDDCLIGIGQFGLHETSEGAIRFKTGTAKLSRNEQQGCWQAIDDKMPVLFSRIDGKEYEKPYQSDAGLTFINTKNNSCPTYLEKTDNERWIDLPLLHSDDSLPPIGKITIACPEDFSHERLKYLEILAAAASTCFAAIDAQELRSNTESAQGRHRMLTVIGETAHQLRSKLQAVLLQAEIIDNKLGVDNTSSQQLIKRIEEVGDVLETIKQRFAPIVLVPENLDLVDFIRRLLHKHLTEEYSRVNAPPSFMAVFDPKLLEEAIEELIENGRKAVFKKRSLQMTASIYGMSRSGVPWCRLEIQDNGDGLPEENRNKPIKEFASEWPGHERGTGLGLARVSNIIAEHGGTIQSVDSSWGARFRMEFPRFGKGQGPRSENDY